MGVKDGKPVEHPYIYKKADTSFVVNNNDVDLTPIRISLPKPPPYYLIDGYGKPPEEQYFRRLEILSGLKDIEADVAKEMRQREADNKNFKATGERIITSFWEIFEKERKHGYDEVAEFIKEVHWCRLHGYWFFNDGKPTYITGDYFDYLNFWTFQDEKGNDGGHVEYRDADRRRYLFRRYAWDTHESVTMVDNKPRVEDMGMRVCYGTGEPKGRRGGITGQALQMGYKHVTEGYGRYFTIISMEGNNASVHYKKKLLPAWGGYPLWLQPVYYGSPVRSITFDLPNKLINKDALGGVMDYTDSGGERANDGDKLHFLLSDEGGKTERADILERHNVNKKAMSLGGGSKIIGFSINPSTVEEMDIGGLEYYKLMNQSKFYNRNDNGQTASGLFEFFIPSWDGQEGFIDRFGMSVVEKPTQRQIDLSPDAIFAKKRMGAREFLQNDLDALLKDATPEDMETYRSTRRKMPMRYSDCWLGTSGDVGFDIEAVDARMAQLRRGSKVRIGRLDWENGFGSTVKFKDDPEGNFELSLILQDHERNQMIQEDYYDHLKQNWFKQWRPKNPHRFTAGIDPFRFGTSNAAKQMDSTSRQSDGGIAVLWERDNSIDASEDMAEWHTHRFVLSYRYRPPALADYCEDVLKVCVYFGAMVYMERNIERVWEYFVDNGFGGYLLYEIDRTTGKKAEKPGFMTFEQSKNDIFSLTKDYIKFRVHKEEHASYLQECKDIRGLEQMGKFDRFVAHGACLLGSRQNYHNIIRELGTQSESGTIDTILNFFKS
jgi:hypothetical protein